MNLVGEFELNYANLNNYTRHIPFPIVTDISYSSDCVLRIILSDPSLSSVWNVKCIEDSTGGNIFQVE